MWKWNQYLHSLIRGKNMSNLITWGVGIIIASNDWTTEVEQLSPDKQNWLTENVIYIKVKEKLWVRD